MHACMARTIFGIKGTAPSTMVGRRDGRGGELAGLAAPCGGLTAWQGPAWAAASGAAALAEVSASGSGSGSWSWSWSSAYSTPYFKALRVDTYRREKCS